MADIKVKFIDRYTLPGESILPGKVYYCNDTGEIFFDESTITRVLLTNAAASYATEDNLPKSEQITANDIDTFCVVQSSASLMVINSSLTWEKVNTRDELVRIIGEPRLFIPHSLYENGKLIAPRTLMSCVYDDTGMPIGEKINSLLQWMYKINHEGLDASLIKTGLLNLNVIPKTAKMDFVVVADAEKRLSLTIDNVQNGDVVQQADDGSAYFIVDDTKLGTAEASEAFQKFTTGSIPWNAVLNRPTSLTLEGGANGYTLLDTGSTLAQTHLVIKDIELNVDKATSGILAVERGGTGNQTGIAPLVKMINADTEIMNLIGRRSDGSVGYATGATVSGNVVSAAAFTANDSAVSSLLNNTIVKGSVAYDTSSTGGACGETFYNAGETALLNGMTINSTKNTITFGDKGIISLIQGADIKFNAKSFAFGLSDTFFSITGAAISCHRDLQVGTRISVYSNTKFTGSPFLTISQEALGRRINDNGATTFNSSINAAVFKSDNFVYAFRRDPSAVSDNILVLYNDGADLEGILKVRGTSLFNGIMTVSAAKNAAGYNIDGTTKYSVDSDKLDGYHYTDFVRKSEVKGGNTDVSSVITQTSAPAGRFNCLWINTATGVPHYWNGASWTPVSAVWKTT